MAGNPTDTEALKRRAAEISKRASGTPKTLATVAAAQKFDAQDPEGLSAQVKGAHERRCPFLHEYSPKEDMDVDTVCTVRIQKFDSNFPFGPVDLKVCELCMIGKGVEVNEDQTDAALDMASRRKCEHNNLPGECEVDRCENAPEPENGPGMHG